MKKDDFAVLIGAAVVGLGLVYFMKQQAGASVLNATGSDVFARARAAVMASGWPQAARDEYLVALADGRVSPYELLTALGQAA